MRTYFRYILIALLSCAVSCTTNDEIADPNGEGKMSLRLVSSAMTRASDAQHNEDFLDKVDLYLFGSTAEASKWHTTIDTNANGSITLNGENEIYIPASALNSVGDSPKLYVIANYDNATTPLPESATLAELQKQVVAKATWGPTAETEAWKAQSSFVMEGLGDVTKNGNQLSGTVNLKRAAAKIDLSITDIVDQVEAGDYVWKPVVGADHALNVTLKNAVTTSYVGADWDKTYEYFGTNGSTINYTFTAGTSSTVDGATITPYSQTNPFYSYSSDQAKGANEAYMVLVVPWQKYDKQNNAVGDVENLYYEVPIGVRDNKRIERNYHYKVSIYVGTLGSKSKDENVTLEPEITVVDWSTGQIAVDIKEARYLVVEDAEIEMYNVTNGAISYSSSHPVTAKIDRIVFNSYKLANTREIEITPTAKTITPAAQNLTIADVYADYDLSYDSTTGVQTLNNLPKGNATFQFTHAIPSYYTARTIYVTVQHTDNAKYSQQVKIVQYPPIYFVGEVATGRVYVNANYCSTGDRISVNDDNGVGIGSVRNPSTVTPSDTASNQNVNNYDIYVTVLPTSYGWQIGDPRETTGGALDGIDELSNYRKTRTDAVDVIAPAFKIASSRGKTTDMTFAQAAKRCASYQENGFPAGRWRVPTPAEIEFIISRSADGDIPSLFDGEYWAGNGQYFDSDDKQLHSSTGSQAVRCVYDIWYWGDDNIEGALNKSIWGDVKNNATLNAENPAN